MILAGIPAFNESKNIERVVRETKRFVDLVVVVDDGSTDDTAALAGKAGALVISHGRNMGVGAAENTILDCARTVLKEEEDILITLDGDGQHFAADIPAMLESLASGHDVINGSRLYQKDQQGPTPWRRVLNGIATYIVRAMSRYYSTDSQSGFRAYRHWVVKRLRYTSTDYAWNSEGYIRLAAMGATIGETRVRTVWTPPSSGREHATIFYGIKVLGRLILIKAGMLGRSHPLLPSPRQDVIPLDPAYLHSFVKSGARGALIQGHE